MELALQAGSFLKRYAWMFNASRSFQQYLFLRTKITNTAILIGEYSLSPIPICINRTLL